MLKKQTNTSKKVKNNYGGQNEAAQVVILNSAVRNGILPFDIEYTKCERLQV